MSPSRQLISASLALSTFVSACGQPERRTDMTLPEQTELKKSPSAADKPPPRVVGNTTLPAPTMSGQQIRQAIWDIAARHMRGDIAKVLAEYQGKADATHTLEARFLAAMAIADVDEQWHAVYALWEEYPNYVWAHAAMAAIYAGWKVRDHCEKEINLALEAGPDVLWSYTIRGDLYRRLGELKLAQRDYEVAVRGDPQDADARVGLALVRRAQGKTDTLRTELEQALRDVPTHYEAAENLALLLDDAQDPQALNAWTRLGELAPKNRMAQLAIARLCADSDAERAAEAYDKAAKTGPLTKTEEETVAKLYYKLNRPDDEIKAWQTIARLDPKDPIPLRRIAEVEMDKKDWEKAEQAYLKLLDMAPTDPDGLMGLGRSSEKRTLLRKAIDYYRRAQSAGAPAAKGELARLSAECMLPSKPITGRDYNTYYANVMASIQAMYTRRLAEAPRLKGDLKLRVETDATGRILDVDVIANSLNDPWLEAHAFYVVADSKFPALKADQFRKFGMPFSLDPSKR